MTEPNPICRVTLFCFAALVLLLPVFSAADGLDEIKDRGVLRVAVYEDFAPFSRDGKGIDVDLANALAEKLGLKADVVSFDAGEDMADDLRNMIWKGHYLRYPVAHVMLHVPVDRVLTEKIPQVHIFAPYFHEQIAVLRNLKQVPVFVGLEAFTRIKIGVEGGSLAQSYLLGSLGGRFADNVVQFKTIRSAAEALKDGTVGAVMGSRAQIEAAMGPITKPFELTPFAGVGMTVHDWNLGLAVKADNPRLAEALNQAMEQLSAEGWVANVFARYRVSYQPPVAKDVQ